jgi:hypothetical protein
MDVQAAVVFPHGGNMMTGLSTIVHTPYLLGTCAACASMCADLGRDYSCSRSAEAMLS